MIISAAVVIVAGFSDSSARFYRDTTYAFSVSLLSKVFHQGKAIAVDIIRLKTWFENLSVFPRKTLSCWSLTPWYFIVVAIVRTLVIKYDLYLHLWYSLLWLVLLFAVQGCATEYLLRDINELNKEIVLCKEWFNTERLTLRNNNLYSRYLLESSEYISHVWHSNPSQHLANKQNHLNRNRCGHSN